MTWQVLVTVFTFGGIGAVVRGAVIFILAMPSVFFFPLSTLLINLIAALLGGFILSMTLPPDISTTLSVGLVGGMGTLSAFTGDVLNHWFDNRHRKKVILITAAYIMLTTITGILGAGIGSKLGEAVQKSHVQSSDAALFLEQTRALQQQFMDESFVHEHYHAPIPGSPEDIALKEAEAKAKDAAAADGKDAGAAEGSASGDSAAASDAEHGSDDGHDHDGAHKGESSGDSAGAGTDKESDKVKEGR
ncbi:MULTISPECIES: CrcB family protein [unclassified Anaerobiospirillum]|uniref:CrcB family protein n=1 Tax=unclassified Anaerobiospirillum TaxID=2647410 RepID=UPI001FF18604|nr:MULTISPECIES: CrcB family protein [unclassified Anaerobiospirillum]MCK0534169.1 CrcB family protein [Anaerobiospirillum sp. NML120511]MCK0539287.1 CrcB family protein [Anaerobiospirillum sp. NML02-A-032]